MKYHINLLSLFCIVTSSTFCFDGVITKDFLQKVRPDFYAITEDIKQNDPEYKERLKIFLNARISQANAALKGDQIIKRQEYNDLAERNHSDQWRARMGIFRDTDTPEDTDRGLTFLAYYTIILSTRVFPALECVYLNCYPKGEFDVMRQYGLPAVSPEEYWKKQQPIKWEQKETFQLEGSRQLARALLDILESK